MIGEWNSELVVKGWGVANDGSSHGTKFGKAGGLRCEFESLLVFTLKYQYTNRLR
jgi:hypothetical protein